MSNSKLELVDLHSLQFSFFFTHSYCNQEEASWHLTQLETHKPQAKITPGDHDLKKQV